MKRGPIGIAAVAVVGVAAWLVLRPAGSGAPEGGPDGSLSEGGADAPGTAPGSAAAASLAKTDAARAGRGRAGGTPHGAAGIVGVVRRDGRPAAAKVELTYLGDVPVARGWSYQTWITRLLDSAGPGTPFATTRSGEDGRFAFQGIGVGSFQVVARAEDGAHGAAQAVVPVDGVRVEANPTISGGDERLAGRVIHADGRPFSGVVSVDAVASGLPPGAIGNPTPLDAEGRFAATGLSKGQVTVSAVDPGAFRATSVPIPVPYDGEFTFTVDAGAVAVSGRVVADEGGAPVPGAAVFSGGQGGLVATYFVQATADADGRFAIAVPPGRGFAVSARAPGFALAVRQDVDPPVEVRLVRASRVAGRVLGPSGAGVEGVTVQATPLSRSAGWGSSAEPAVSAADGAYALEDLGAGEVMVVAEGKGWTTKGIDGVRDGGFNPLAVTLRPGELTACDVAVVRGGSVSGVVREADGTGVAGAVVRAEPQRQERIYYGAASTPSGSVAASGADGAFVLDGLATGSSYVVAATAAGRATARSEPVTVDGGAAPKVEIRLAPERRIEVLVVEEGSGAPVPGASVSAQAEVLGGGWRMEGPGSWTTGSDGRVLAGPVGPGALQVSVRAEGWVPADVQTVAAGEATPLTFRLPRGLVIAGKVLMPDKSPAIGVRVSVRPENERGGRWQNSSTGPDGAFTAGGLAAGAYRLSAEGARDGDRVPLFATASATAGQGPVTLVLAPGAGSARRLVVRALDPDGKPVPRARLQFRSAQGGSNSTSLQDGKGTLDLGDRDDAGTVTVSAATTTAGVPLPYAPKSVPDVKPSAGEVVVKLDPGQSLAGTVRDPDGQGVRGALVFANEAGDGSTRRRGGGGESLATARTDAGGAYRLDGLGSDEVTVSVDVPAEFLAPEPVAARAGAGGLDIVLKPAASFAVTVVDWLDRPVAGARVSARAAEKPSADPRRRGGGGSYDSGRGAATDARGVARLGSLDPAGRYDVTVNPPAAREDLQAGTLSNVAPSDATVRLERGFVLEVRVVDLAGKPVSGAHVQRKTGDRSWSGVGEREREPGVLRLTRLPAGDLVLAATMGSVSPDEDDPRVGRVATRADAGTATIRIDPGLELTVKVEGAPSRPWWNAQLLDESADAGRGRRSVGPEGDLTWRGLRADTTYTLWIAPEPGGALSCFKKGVHPGGELVVTLEKGRTIAGRVSAPAGTTQMSVNAWCSLGINVQGKVDADGRYELAGLPEGTTWRVGANGRIGDAWAQGQSAAEVPAGSSVDLEIKKQQEK